MIRRLVRFAAWLGTAAFLAAAAAMIAIVLFVIPELPSIEALKDVRFQVPLRIYSADGKLMAEFGEKRRKPLEPAQVPAAMIKAIIASEDQHFYQHPGVDWRGLARAVLHLARTGKKGPGGSTITMQVARNFFLSREKTYLRKLNEILLALKIERELDKDEILSLYINKIFLGHRAYGIAAAAEVYYGKPVGELTLAQMAMIAGLPQRPSGYNPITNPSAARARRDYVLGRMLAGGAIGAEAFERARAAPVTARLHRPVVELEALYVSEMVRDYMEQWQGDRAYTDGYHVITTIDSRLQRSANRATRQALVEYDTRHGYRGPELQLTLDPESGPERFDQLLRDIPTVGGLRPGLVLEVAEQDAKVYVHGHGEIVVDWEGIRWARAYVDANRRGPKPKTAADVLSVGDVIRVRLGEDGWRLAQVPKVEGALLALDPKDGSLLALTGGFDFFRSKFNRATQARRQPGSNFKPFIYSAALEHGFTAASLINDAPVVFDDPGLEDSWRPENYSGKFFGPTRLRWALTKSRNLVSIRLLRAIGIDTALGYVARFGLDTSELPRDLSLALGSGGVTPIEVAAGYAVLANGGYAVKPYFIDRILDARGDLVLRPEHWSVCRECERARPGQPGATAAATSTGAGALVAAQTGAGSPVRTASRSAAAAPAAPGVAPRVISEQIAWIMTSMLRDVVKYGTGRRALVLGRDDLAGKTGTTNDQRDAWFSGYTPDLVATAWVGFDQVAPLGRRETGSRAALPMWIKFMAEALAGRKPVPLEPPDGLVTVRIDRSTGQYTDGSNPNAIFEIFRAEHAPRPDGPPIANSAVDTGSSVLQPDRNPGPNATAPDSDRAEGTTKRLF